MPAKIQKVECFISEILHSSLFFLAAVGGEEVFDESERPITKSGNDPTSVWTMATKGHEWSRWERKRRVGACLRFNGDKHQA